MGNKKVFVGSLPWSVNNDSLKELFAAMGEIVDAVVITDRATGRSRGFGFVTFADEAAAKKAVDEMNEKEIEGRKIFVNFAKEQTDRRE
ncbi:RNA-binding protein [Candidatus Roizmanbacteria bacterium RIFCSPHIGHO2_12_FULL_33_9]|uniref:RNA-binding protein n=1 Tax=Candidatus Roizmanbacteria bacterium RIFCSPHIGHO2_12_FULL_33_9 TaxID=1802045 RepID=A0A1F7HFT5_9BACT|nr:MAG: RNA-binding protein [Candidatus Roizmanbacteria bacterium RIFCSPHIGHO2_12_FULL_33_9]